MNLLPNINELISLTPKSYWTKKTPSRRIEKRRNNLNRKLEIGYFRSKLAESASKNSLYRMELRNNPTKAEQIVGDWMWKNKIDFKFQKGFIIPFHRICDFYLARYSLILEIDGGYHEQTKYKDNLKDELWLKKRGMWTIRIKNEEVYDGTFKDKLSHLLPKKRI